MEFKLDRGLLRSWCHLPIFLVNFPISQFDTHRACSCFLLSLVYCLSVCLHYYQRSLRKILNSQFSIRVGRSRADSHRAEREAQWTFFRVFYESASGNNSASGPIEVLAVVSSKAGEVPAGAAVCPLVSLSIIRRPVANSRSPLCPSPPPTLLPCKLPCMEIDHYEGDCMAPTMGTRSKVLANGSLSIAQLGNNARRKLQLSS